MLSPAPGIRPVTLRPDELSQLRLAGSQKITTRDTVETGDGVAQTIDTLQTSTETNLAHVMLTEPLRDWLKTEAGNTSLDTWELSHLAAINDITNMLAEHGAPIEALTEKSRDLLGYASYRLGQLRDQFLADGNFQFSEVENGHLNIQAVIKDTEHILPLLRLLKKLMALYTEDVTLLGKLKTEIGQMKAKIEDFKREKQECDLRNYPGRQREQWIDTVELPRLTQEKLGVERKKTSAEKRMKELRETLQSLVNLPYENVRENQNKERIWEAALRRVKTSTINQRITGVDIAAMLQTHDLHSLTFPYEVEEPTPIQRTPPPRRSSRRMIESDDGTIHTSEERRAIKRVLGRTAWESRIVGTVLLLMSFLVGKEIYKAINDRPDNEKPAVKDAPELPAQADGLKIESNVTWHGNIPPSVTARAKEIKDYNPNDYIMIEGIPIMHKTEQMRYVAEYSKFPEAKGVSKHNVSIRFLPLSDIEEAIKKGKGTASLQLRGAMSLLKLAYMARHGEDKKKGDILMTLVYMNGVLIEIKDQLETLADGQPPVMIPARLFGMTADMFKNLVKPIDEQAAN